MSNERYDAILGVKYSGIIPAHLVARELNVNYIQFIPIRNKKIHKEELPLLFKGKKYLIIDEIYATCALFQKCRMR
jgi:adenine/guanine phosphoribosyltransferase-like PRPP-binding protein